MRDGKIDLVLQKLGAKKVDDFSEVLLQYIKDHEGFTPLNDKSAAEDIYDAFGVSKKTFKKAVGDLYKKRLVVLEAEGNTPYLVELFPTRYRKSPYEFMGKINCGGK